jgi:PAS domain S-box-containing protein
MEESLKESEERFRFLVEQSPFGIGISRENKFIYMNLAGARIFGANNPEELIGKARMDFIHPEFRPMVRERIKLEEEGKIAPCIEEKWIRPDGSVIDVEIVSIPFIFKGKFSTYGVFQDITDRKKLEQIRLENKQLFLASKAKSEFIATLSHEIRTPLTSIMGFSELLKDKAVAGELNEEAEHFVDKVISNSNHLLELLNDILDIGKIEAGKLELEIEKFSLHDTVEEVVLLMEENASKHNILIKKDLIPLEIHADKRRIKQILLNILWNAVKFSKQDGGMVTINTTISGDMVMISISDTGIGIKKEDLSRLFWSFEQLDSGMSRKYGGTGLGLAISDKLAKLHGGRIEVKSEYGKWSTFILMLPLNPRISQGPVFERRIQNYS